MPATSFLGPGSADAAALAGSVAAGTTLTCPSPPATTGWAWDWAPALDTWTRAVGALAPAEHVVVCTWPEAAPIAPLAELRPDEWRQQVEWPTALWFTTLVAAAGRCRDGGSLVAVVDRPASLDALGHGAAVVVAEGVMNLVRSLAAREGGRGVRVNTVVTARGTDPQGLLGAPPPLATFPGRIDAEIAGAVRMLLGPDAAGITGRAIHATSGRA